MWDGGLNSILHTYLFPFTFNVNDREEVDEDEEKLTCIAKSCPLAAVNAMMMQDRKPAA